MKPSNPSTHPSTSTTPSIEPTFSNSIEFISTDLTTPLSTTYPTKRKHYKPHSNARHKLTRSLELSTDYQTELCINDTTNYDKLTTSRKLKQNYYNKYIILSNRINTLKKHEKELENKMNIYLKKEKKIESIKKDKLHLKTELSKHKAQQYQHLQAQKEKIKTRRETETERLNTLHEIKAEKRKILFEISKADQNLVKTLITQTNTKTNAVNKYKYLQFKEKKEMNKQIEKRKRMEKETKKINHNKEICERNIAMAEELKLKCKELEKIEEQYMNNLKQTKMKAFEFMEKAKVKGSCGLYINRSLIEEELRKGGENENMNVNGNGGNKGKYKKHKSRSIHIKDCYRSCSNYNSNCNTNNNTQIISLQSEFNGGNKKYHKTNSECCMTVGNLSHYQSQ